MEKDATDQLKTDLSIIIIIIIDKQTIVQNV